MIAVPRGSRSTKSCRYSLGPSGRPFSHHAYNSPLSELGFPPLRKSLGDSLHIGKSPWTTKKLLRCSAPAPIWKEALAEVLWTGGHFISMVIFRNALWNALVRHPRISAGCSGRTCHVHTSRTWWPRTTTTTRENSSYLSHAVIGQAVPEVFLIKAVIHHQSRQQSTFGFFLYNYTASILSWQLQRLFSVFYWGKCSVWRSVQCVELLKKID